jgi:hypothetical protein
MKPYHPRTCVNHILQKYKDNKKEQKFKFKQQNPTDFFVDTNLTRY